MSRQQDERAAAEEGKKIRRLPSYLSVPLAISTPSLAVSHFRGDIIKYSETSTMAHMVKCIKFGKEMEGLDEPPFDSPLGQKIYENVSKQAWMAWTDHMKMLLNEYRLQPWKKDHQDFIVQQMEAYFFGEGSEKPQEYVPPSQ